MEVTDLLDPSGVIPNLRVTGKRQALQELARRAATLTGEDEHAGLVDEFRAEAHAALPLPRR